MRKGNIQKNSTLKDYYGKDASPQRKSGCKTPKQRRQNGVKNENFALFGNFSAKSRRKHGKNA